MKRTVVILFSLTSLPALHAQNIVNNPGFETYSSLPTSFGQITFATGWSNPTGGSGTSDYYHTSGSVGTSFGQITPIGSGQAGFLTRHSSAGVAMEYVCGSLTTPMVPGASYEVSFRLTRGTGAGIYPSSTANIGVYFSTAIPAQPGAGIIAATPQVEQTVTVTTTNSWSLHTFYFTPSAAFTHLTIGNFHTFAATPYTGGDGRAYYFVDDIVVQQAVPLASNQYQFDAVRESEDALLTWQWNAHEQIDNVTIQRSADGITYDNMATLDYDATAWRDEMPFTGTNRYRLRFLRSDGTVCTTENRSVFFDESAAVVAGRIFPNPFRDWIVIDFRNEGAPDNVAVEILDLTGKEVYSHQPLVPNGLSKIELDLSSVSIAQGTYLLSITSGSGKRQLEKIMKE